MKKTILIVTIFLVLASSSAAPAYAQQKPYGGTMIVGVTASVKNLNPARISAYDWATYTLYYDFLWVYGTDFSPTPYLAESWDVSPDGLTTTYHLRTNAYWHDGERLTAADVCFTYDTIMWDPIWVYAIDSVESCEVVDDYTVVFHQSSPLAVVPMRYSMIIPKHVWEPMLKQKGILDQVLAHNETALAQMAEWPNDPLIGSGMFKLKTWVPGEYTELEAFDKWWGGRPYLDRLIFKEFASTDSALMALKNGEIDTLGYDTLVPPTAIKDVEAQPGISLIKCKSLADYALSFNVWSGWPKQHPEAATLEDINLRKAMAYVIDKKTIADVLYFGQATPIYSYIPQALTYWYNPDVPKYEYDLTKAAEILDNAGYKLGSDGIRRSPKGLKLSFELVLDSAQPIHVRMAELIRDDAKQVGIEIAVRPVDYATLYDMLYYSEGPKYDMAITNQMEASPDPHWVSSFFYKFNPGEWNIHGYTNPEYDKLYKAQATNPDRASRKQEVFRMQEIIAEDVPAIPIVSPDILRPYRSDKWEDLLPEVGGTFNWIMPQWTAEAVHLKAVPTTTATPPSVTTTTAPVQATTTAAAPTGWTPEMTGGAIAVIVVIVLLSYAIMRRRKPKQ